MLGVRAGPLRVTRDSPHCTRASGKGPEDAVATGTQMVGGHFPCGPQLDTALSRAHGDGREPAVGLRDPGLGEMNLSLSHSLGVEPSLKRGLPGSLTHDLQFSGRFCKLLKVGSLSIILCLPLPWHKALLAVGGN